MKAVTGWAMLGVAVVLAGCGDGSATAPDVPAGPPVAVTAQELFDAFEANEVAAKAQFDGQRIAVTGTIAGVTLDFMDNPVVQLETENDFMPVQASFEKADATRTAALAKGEIVTVTCGKVSEVIGAPQLDECSLP